VDINRKKIEELIDENYIYASVLYYFGIKFYNYSEKTLQQVCLEKGLDIRQVILSLEAVSNSDESQSPELSPYPIDIIIEYLKHTHYIFVKRKLPYIAKLIDELEDNARGYEFMVNDLKLAFPLFIEDFIHHIHEEEDTLFTYILLLNKFLEERSDPVKLFYEIGEHSISQYGQEHDAHDDEMLGFKEITRNYLVLDPSHLHVRVLFAELQSFEKALDTHAKIENEILFPKALALEKEARVLLGKLAKLN